VQFKLPPKVFVERPCNSSVREAYVNAGAPHHIADFLGRRLDSFIDWQLLVSPKLSAIADPGAIPSMDRAVERIVRAILQHERIALACDHDMDGTASAAVLWSALVDFFGVEPDRITVVTSHRLTEGYGISEPVVSRIESFGATLVISADKGSSDEPRIATLAASGIDVVVTDHHVIPQAGPPQSAYAVVNPSRLDAEYDRHVCGAGVAFLVMAKVRSALLERGASTQILPLTSLLDFVAVATIADCVSLSPGASLINRAFIRRGLDQVRSQSRPCWEVFAQEQQGDIDAETIAFRMAPAIAAAGRLDWAESGFRFLISKSETEAALYWSELKRENSERQTIERRLRHEAFPRAAQITSPAIVLFFEDGHSGVHGITASRVVEAFGKPCAIFAPKGHGARSTASAVIEGLASGSFRSIPTVDVQRALQHVANAHPGLLLSHGGHQAAAGATIQVSDLPQFEQAFYEAVAHQTAGAPESQPTIYTDGELDAISHTWDAMEAFDTIGPFGRGFDPPIYSGIFCVDTYHAMTEGQHARLRLRREDLVISAVWFNIESALERLPFIGDRLNIAYRLARRSYQGMASLQATIIAGSIYSD
jgi:single-stranded-DNA-specific exonuclease